MAKTYVKDGNVVTYLNPGTAISSGDVVSMGDLVGVAIDDIAVGAEGAVRISGAWGAAKATGAAWVIGDSLNWDASASRFTKVATAAAGDVTGGAVCIAAAGSADVTGTALLTPGTGTGS